MLSCKDTHHICLIGLTQLTKKLADIFETNNNENIDVVDYHERVIRFLIKDMREKGFRYISIIPGGFN